MNQLVLLWQFFIRCLGFGPGPCLMMIRKDGRTVCRPTSDNHPRFILSMWWRQLRSTARRQSTVRRETRNRQDEMANSRSEPASSQSERGNWDRRNADSTGKLPTSEFVSDDSTQGVSLSGEPPAHDPLASNGSTERPSTSAWPFARILSSNKRAGEIWDQRSWIPQNLGRLAYWTLTCWSAGSLGLANFRMGSLHWCWT